MQCCVDFAMKQSHKEKLNSVFVLEQTNPNPSMDFWLFEQKHTLVAQF